MGRPVVHFEVMGTDGERLRAFYSGLFEWEFQSMPGPMDYAILPREGNTNPDGAGIGGGVGGMAGYDGHLTFYVQVPDIEAALAEGERLGGTRVMGPDEVPGQGLLFAHLRDPAGNMVGLVQDLG